jgi:hypothetical protein
MFKAASQIATWMRSPYASAREVADLHRKQIQKNRFVEGQDEHLESSLVRTRALKLAPALGLGVQGAHGYLNAAALVMGKTDHHYNEGCVVRERSQGDFARFMFAGGTATSFKNEKTRIGAAVVALQHQYDFSQARASFDQLLNSYISLGKGEVPHDEYEREAATSMIMDWLAQQQAQLGSNWMVIVDEPTMHALRPDLYDQYLGAKILHSEEHP